MLKNITILIVLVLADLVSAKSNLSTERLSQLSGEKQNSFDSKSEWDQAYSRNSFIFGKTPAKFLAENFDYIPEGSTVLDMGMGEGRNAVFLAQKGHKVTGVDISSVAIKKSYLLAKEYGVKIKGVVASLSKYQIPPESFDAIICFYFINRDIVEKMKSWLKPGGLIIYEAYTELQKTVKSHRKYEESQYLKQQELLKLFGDMRVLKYEEPLHEEKYRASIILRKE
tara:strand:+ start:82956 stop:83633 length:678 start_codon:yes stop_codon:yes gene_type:complete